MEEQSQVERNQFKELLKDKEEEIELLSKQSMGNGEFDELNQLLNAEKAKNETLQAQIEASNNDASATDNSEITEVQSLKEQLNQKEEKLSEFKQKVELLEKEVKDKTAFIQKLKLQHESSIQILKQSTQVAVEENNELSEKIVKLEKSVNDSQAQFQSSQKNNECLQEKLEKLSHVNEENSKLKAEKLQLECDRTKLEDQLREVQTRLDNGQNEQLEHSKNMHEDKVLLENECSELKEKIEILLQDLKSLKAQLVEHNQTINDLRHENESKTQQHNLALEEKDKVIQKHLDELQNVRAEYELDVQKNLEFKNVEVKTMKDETISLKSEIEILKDQVQAQEVQNSSENEQIAHWKSQYEQLKTESKNEIEQLEFKLNEISNHNESLNQELNDKNSEIEALDQVVSTLKDKNKIFEDNKEATLIEAEQFQNQLSSMQNNLDELGKFNDS